jgi:hypothetical protein
MVGFPSIIIGMPALDVAPFGLGFRICRNTFAFDALGGVQLPRLDLTRRDAMWNTMAIASAASEDNYADEDQCMGVWGTKCTGVWGASVLSGGLVRSPSQSSVASSDLSLAGEEDPPLVEASFLADPILLESGDSAEVPVAWTPTAQAAKRPLPETALVRGRHGLPLKVVKGEFDPSERAVQKVLVYNADVVEHWLEPGEVIAWGFPLKPSEDPGSGELQSHRSQGGDTRATSRASSRVASEVESRAASEQPGTDDNFQAHIVQDEDPQQVLRDDVPPDEFFDLLRDWYKAQ